MMTRRGGGGALAVVALVGAGLLLARLHEGSDAPYSVRQLVQELRGASRALIGQTASVRAVVQTFSWGTGNGLIAGRQTFLVDDPNVVLETFPSYGAKVGSLNHGAVNSSLLISGPNPAPSTSRRFLLFLSGLPLLGRFVRVDPFSADVYRIRIVSTHPCPSAFGGFCPTGIVVP